MSRVFLLILALQRSSGVLLGKESQESNYTVTGGAKQWLKFAGIVKTSIEIGNHYNNAIHVHMGDINDLSTGDHARQQDLANLAGDHPYAYAFVNINLAAAEDYWGNVANDKVDGKVRQAQRKFIDKNWGNMAVRGALHLAGDQVKQKISDKMTEIRNEADIQILEWYHDKQKPVKVKGTVDAGMVMHKLGNMGLNKDGQMAFFQMVEQMQQGERLMLASTAQDFVTVSNEMGEIMVNKDLDGNEMAKGLQVMADGLDKTRDAIGVMREQFLKGNQFQSRTLALSGKADLAEKLFKAWLSNVAPDLLHNKQTLTKLLEAASERVKYCGEEVLKYDEDLFDDALLGVSGANTALFADACCRL